MCSCELSKVCLESDRPYDFAMLGFDCRTFQQGVPWDGGCERVDPRKEEDATVRYGIMPV